MNERKILMLHGSPATGQAWSGVINHLGDDWQALAPTLPDHDGASPPRRLEIADIADLVLEEIDVPTAPMFLAGHSFGATVCLEIARTGRLPLAGIVLFEPAPLCLLSLAGRPDLYAAIYDHFSGYVADFEAGNRLAIRTMIEYWFGNGAFEALPIHVRDYLLAATPINIRDIKAGFRQTCTAQELSEIRAPVLIAYGAAGPPIIRDLAETVAGAFAHGNSVAIAGANHGMLSEHPAAVAQVIKQILPSCTKGH